MDLAYEAMLFAREAHDGHQRKYTKTPYFDHLAEVAGILSTVTSDQEALAVAWLHDCAEDRGVQLSEIESLFGVRVAIGVSGLSDMEKGNRAARKAASCERLSKCSGWIQTIKCADLISNTGSIVMHDPKFAVTYLAEKRALLSVMALADRRLHGIASDLCAAFAFPKDRN